MSKKTQYIVFSTGINTDTANALVNTVYSVAKVRSCEQVYLLLNSPGGSIEAANYAYNMLRALPRRFVTYNMGFVSSMALFVYLSGEQRYVSPTASFQFESLHWDFGQAANLPVWQLEEKLGLLRNEMDRMASVYADRTGTPFSAADCFPETPSRISAADAVVKGIAHENLNLKLPKEVQLHHIS